MFQKTNQQYQRVKKTDDIGFDRNEYIRAYEMRVIGSDGENLGTLTKQAALDIAREQELDLVLIAPNAVPPVAKIIDWSKFKYERSKKQRESKGKKSELKEMWFKPKIEEGDILHKIKRVREFIDKGDRVKITVKVRGGRILREQVVETMHRILAHISEFAAPDGEPKFEGRNMSVFISKRK